MEIQQTSAAGSEIRLRQNRAMVVGYPDELRLQPSNEDLLRQIATATGGTFNGNMDQIMAPKQRTVRRREPLWPLLLMAALTLFVVDVLLRRIDLQTVLGAGKQPAKPANA